MSQVFLPLRNILLQLGLVNPECFNELFVKFNVGHSVCAKSFLSKGLGMGIVAGSAMVKLPQVFKILGSGSAEGLSLLGTLLELTAVTANGAYSYSQDYPFSTYGEAVFLGLQTSFIAFLILLFSGRSIFAVIFSMLYAGLAWAILQPGLIPAEVLWYGQAANIPMVVIGKLIQVIANYRNGHTGQLSAITVFMLALGSLARIFTSIQETGDRIVIMTFVCSSAVNCLLALQVLWYWNASKPSGSSSGRKAAQQQQQKKKNKPKKA